MESNPHDPIAKSRRPASPSFHKKSAVFSALNPAAMGLDMPDWLAPSMPSVQSPADAALPSDAAPRAPQSPPELDQESLVSPPLNYARSWKA
jgi:hypothetical protein